MGSFDIKFISNVVVSTKEVSGRNSAFMYVVPISPGIVKTGSPKFVVDYIGKNIFRVVALFDIFFQKIV